MQFRAEDGTEHSVWAVRDPVDVFAIQRAFESVKTTYIADGHHRSASAFRLAIAVVVSFKTVVGVWCLNVLSFPRTSKKCSNVDYT